MDLDECVCFVFKNNFKEVHVKKYSVHIYFYYFLKKIEIITIDWMLIYYNYTICYRIYLLQILLEIITEKQMLIYYNYMIFIQLSHSYN